MVVMPIVVSRASVAGPYAAHERDSGQFVKEVEFVSGSTTTNPSGFATCDATFARCLVRATPIDIGKPSSARTRARTVLAISAGEPKRCVHPATSAKASSMEMRSMEGVTLLVSVSDGGVAEPLVFVVMPADKHEVGTELPRAPSRHAASHAEGPRFVGGRENDAAADRNRLAAQARVKQLSDRRIKGVEVRVENGGCGNPSRCFFAFTHHSADASRDSSSAGPTLRRSATGAPAATNASAP